MACGHVQRHPGNPVAMTVTELEHQVRSTDSMFSYLPISDKPVWAQDKPAIDGRRPLGCLVVRSSVTAHRMHDSLRTHCRADDEIKIAEETGVRAVDRQPYSPLRDASFHGL